MRCALFLLLFVWPALVAANPPGPPVALCSSGTHGQVMCIRPAHFAHDTCQAIEHFAEENDLDPGFFARLIWQESRFDPNALSPADARGVAQFIDKTAALRGLSDSYNPALALEYSAEYLGELTRRYGNHGLAAVAYNGGERRADGLVAGTGGLAQETIDYVRIITGLSAETWRDAPPEDHDFRLDGDTHFQAACLAMAQTRRLTRLAPPEPPLDPWGAQLAFGRDRLSAERKVARSACRGATGNAHIAYVTERSRASATGRYVFARAGAATRDAAFSICARVRARGCPCAVYRNK